MKLLDLIHPYFGAISICDAFIGDARKEWALDDYDVEGRTRMDPNYHLFAKLDLKDLGFDNGIVRFEFYGDNETIVRIFLDVVFDDSSTMKESNIGILYEYLCKFGYYDYCPRDDGDWLFRNALNEIHVEVLDDEFLLELYPSSDSGIEPEKNYESGARLTVTNLVRGERDEWDDFIYERLQK